MGGYRPMTMKRLLGPALLAFVLLAGCGDSTSDSASDPVSQPSSSSTSSSTTASDKPTEALAPQTIAIVSQTAAGGQVDLNAVPVDDDAADDEQLTPPVVAEQRRLRAAIEFRHRLGEGEQRRVGVSGRPEGVGEGGERAGGCGHRGRAVRKLLARSRRG